MVDDPALAIAVPLIAKFEGFRSKVYQDVAGVWTVGYGSTYLLDGSHVTINTPPISEPDARAMLATVVARTLAAVRGMVKVPMTDGQAAALASFAYNLGPAALRASTLLKKFNAGDTQGAADQFLGWCHAGGRVIQGLVNRRIAERDLFLAQQVMESPNV